MRRLHRYVGPPAIAAEAASSRGGLVLRSQDDVSIAAKALGISRSATVTYVVDASGVLRVADRSSEHVDCARGGPVFAAGELELDRTLRAVTSATNLSTGFCPDAGCFDALAAALAGAGIPGPSSFDPAFEMRRCPGCAARQVVKDGVLECAECGADLPSTWNLDRAEVRRARIEVDGVAWVVDSLVEGAERGEDRVACDIDIAGLRIAVADGAGGTGGGALAAERVMAAVARIGIEDASVLLQSIDTELGTRGETTAVLMAIALGRTLSVSGAAVGDSCALALRAGVWIELTDSVARKPLVGSGRARATAFAERNADALLIATDGLFDYASRERIEAIAAGSSAHAAWELADLARLPSGRLHDDLALVLVRRA